MNLHCPESTVRHGYTVVCTEKVGHEGDHRGTDVTGINVVTWPNAAGRN